jgi:hypothetical protein
LLVHALQYVVRRQRRATKILCADPKFRPSLVQ